MAEKNGVCSTRAYTQKEEQDERRVFQLVRHVSSRPKSASHPFMHVVMEESRSHFVSIPFIFHEAINRFQSLANLPFNG